ncbi:hypothetical protein [Larkinella rosea]|uniref:Uncharacterized protein n=1 Tax=Larkinella rosea TaxID=2025312 RepID=A0A3P1BUD7_9BACT|nr:hypothetical protein [Larkinella rosea]RRB04687.1 hypothetical protein EHT25_14550 [Larkinella rosea]
MKTALLFFGLALLINPVIAQNSTDYLKLIPGSERSAFKRLELSSDVDTTWNRWKERGYNFGFNPQITPMYTTVNGILSTPFMIQVRGNENERNRKRWGYHVFEGYARDDKSRITMLVNKHTEEEKPVAELYYYSTVYTHAEPAYNWFKIGSDVRQHSFLFSRDKAVFYGSLKMTNALTLGNIGRDNILAEKPVADAETNYAEDAKHVNYQELKNSENGTIFYDKDNNIVVIKINGTWMKLAVEALPKGVHYSF